MLGLNYLPIPEAMYSVSRIDEVHFGSSGTGDWCALERAPARRLRFAKAKLSRVGDWERNSCVA